MVTITCIHNVSQLVKATGGRVKSLHRRYIGLTHTFGAMLVAKHAQNGLSRNSYALGDTYLLIGVKMAFQFFTCENIRHRASGTMWSVHKALTCRLLFSCPAEHLIGKPHSPFHFSRGFRMSRAPIFSKFHFFYFSRGHFPDILEVQMDPPWNPKKMPKLFSKVIFGGPKPSGRGGSGAALGGEPFGIPKN